MFMFAIKIKKEFIWALRQCRFMAAPSCIVRLPDPLLRVENLSKCLPFEVTMVVMVVDQGGRSRHWVAPGRCSVHNHNYEDNDEE